MHWLRDMLRLGGPADAELSVHLSVDPGKVRHGREGNPADCTYATRPSWSGFWSELRYDLMLFTRLLVLPEDILTSRYYNI